MNHLNKLLILLAGIGLLASCKKSDLQISPLASLNVTNAVIGGATLMSTTSGLTVGGNSYTQFTLIPGQSTVNLYTSATPAVTYYNQIIPTTNGGYYSLFLSGASPAAVDATVVTENYNNYRDSVAGIRFVNLCPGSNPISINIALSANGSEVSSLAYQGVSAFKTYSNDYKHIAYTFEVRDATTGTLITTYAYTASNPLNRFYNTTLVLKGIIGGSPAPSFIVDKDF